MVLPHEDPEHFAHRIDMLDAAGEIQEHLAAVEGARHDHAPSRRHDRGKANGHRDGIG
jgi:hypothetical protein